MSHYQPPLTLTPCMLALVAEIGERVGLLSAQRGGRADAAAAPRQSYSYHPGVAGD